MHRRCLKPGGTKSYTLERFINQRMRLLELFLTNWGLALYYLKIRLLLLLIGCSWWKTNELRF